MGGSSIALFDRSPIERVADEVAEALSQPQAFVSVEAPLGAGRNTVALALLERFPNEAVLVHVPSMVDPDARIHSLLQAAAAVDAELVARVESDGSNAADVAKALAERDRIVLLYVPQDLPSRTDERGPNPGWIASFLGELRETAAKVVALLPEGMSGAKVLPSAPYRLEPCTANLDALNAAELWGTYASDATNLRRSLGSTQTRFSPLQLRLMVGLVGLGVPASRVADLGFQAGRKGQLESLAHSLVVRLRGNPLVQAAVRRMLLIRIPTSVDVVLQIAAPPQEHEALIKHCIGYGDDLLRVPDVIRNHLLHELARDPSEQLAHKKFAEHFLVLDGALSASEAAKRTGSARSNVQSWLEKVHHLAHAGPLGADDWSRQQLKARDFLIDRARALSIHERDYQQAADLFGRVLERWPDDSYSAHYRAFNLDQLGIDPTEVERCFRKALSDRSDNLFYNSRLITFLIERGRPIDAMDQWSQALKNLSTRQPSEIAFHVTLHVVNAWLNAGDVRRARQVFDAGFSLGTEPDPAIARLEQRLLDAEEAEALGVSVYPEAVPMNERWRQPRIAAAKRRTKPLIHWLPGRVIAATPELVRLVFVTPSQNPSERRVIARDVTAQEWNEIADWSTPEQASGFVELAQYAGDDKPVVFSVRSSPPEAETDTRSSAYPFRYLLRPDTDLTG